MAGGFRAYDQYYLAFVVISGTFLGLWFLLWLAQRSQYAAYVKTYRGIAPNFLTVINVIFALNLAFLANDTWNARSRALNAVFQEAGSLRNIVDLAVPLPDPERSLVGGAVRNYVRLTVVGEWPLLGRRQSSPAASEALDALLTLVAGHRLAAGDGGVRALMVEEAMKVRAARDLRITLSQTHVNPLKWLGMAFLGFLTMVSIVMVHVDRPRAEGLAALLFAAAAAPTAALVLIHGNPFQQPLAISPAPIATIMQLAAP